MTACIEPTTLPARNFRITLQYNRSYTSPTNDTERRLGAIHELQVYSRDCLPTVFRMWLKYYRDVAYRQGRLFRSYGDTYTAHYERITNDLRSGGDLASTYDFLPNGLKHEYNATGYSPSASSPGPNANSLDWTKYAFRTSAMGTDFDNVGTLVYDTNNRWDYRNYETHVLYTAQFLGYLIEKMFFNAFDYRALNYYGEFSDFDIGGLWRDFANYFPYPGDGQLPAGVHHIGTGEFVDFIVADDITTFTNQLLAHFDYASGVDRYADGDNYYDRALVLLVKSHPQATSLSDLHYVLVTGMRVHIPAGQPREWPNAQITLEAEDPGQPGLRPLDPTELEDYATIEDPTTHGKLLYHRYMALTVGIPSRGRALSGSRGVDDIAQIDVEARVERYREEQRRAVVRKILPILQLLLGED
jgi:hypothetical protein